MTSGKPTSTKPGTPLKPSTPTFHELLLQAKDQVESADDVTRKKAIIIGVFAILTIIALGIAFLPYVVDGSRSMDARLKINRFESISQTITAFYVENAGKKTWQDKVTLTLNDQYVYDAATVESGKNTVAQLTRFADANGESPEPNCPLRTLKIQTSVGEMTFDLKPCAISSDIQCPVLSR